HAAIESLAGVPTVPVGEPPATALQKFKMAEEYEPLVDDDPGLANESPLERLRFFCSLAMSGRDWLDAEPFFDALSGVPAPSAEPVAPPIAWMVGADPMTAAVYNRGEKAKAFDASIRWGSPITALVPQKGTPTLTAPAPSGVPDGWKQLRNF